MKQKTLIQLLVMFVLFSCSREKNDNLIQTETPGNEIEACIEKMDLSYSNQMFLKNFDLKAERSVILADGKKFSVILMDQRAEFKVGKEGKKTKTYKFLLQNGAEGLSIMDAIPCPEVAPEFAATIASGSKDILKDFSGLLLYYTLDNDFTEGYQYKNGKKDGQVTQYTKEKKLKDQRVDCSELTVYHYTSTCYYTIIGSSVTLNDCTDWHLSYTETLVICGSSGGGCDPAGGGGSGTIETYNSQDIYCDINYLTDITVGEDIDIDFEGSIVNRRELPNLIWGNSIDKFVRIEFKPGVTEKNLNTCLVDIFENVIMEMMNAGYDIRMITISSTNDGDHDPDSNHFRNNALDISSINGVRIEDLGRKDPLVMALQGYADNYEQIRENFGPVFEHKGKQSYNPGSYHGNHIHLSANTGCQ